MNQEAWDLYVEAFCGLVIPFPRLATMYKFPSLVVDQEEFKRLREEEKKYWEKKRLAAEKWYQLTSKEAP